MSYPNPVGYWVSCCSTHPDHQILAGVESQFGSYFENLPSDELQRLLLYCAGGAGTGEAVASVSQLSKESRFGLVPFLHEVISSRGQK